MKRSTVVQKGSRPSWPNETGTKMALILRTGSGNTHFYDWFCGCIKMKQEQKGVFEEI